MARLYSPGRPSRQSPPETAGEYRFVNKETRKVDYLGETNNLKRRRGEHERSSKPVSRETHFFEWKVADSSFSQDTRREHERKKIKQKQPPLNMRSGGGGRKTKLHGCNQFSESVPMHDKPKRSRLIFKLILHTILTLATFGAWLVVLLLWWLIKRARNRRINNPQPTRANSGGGRKLLKIFADIVLIIATGGLWLIWMFIRFIRKRRKASK